MVIGLIVVIIIAITGYCKFVDYETTKALERINKDKRNG